MATRPKAIPKSNSTQIQNNLDFKLKVVLIVFVSIIALFILIIADKLYVIKLPF